VTLRKDASGEKWGVWESEGGTSTEFSTPSHTIRDSCTSHQKRDSQPFFPNHHRKKMSIARYVLSQNRIHRTQIIRKHLTKTGKTKRTSKASPGPIGKGGQSVVARYVLGETNQADRPSRAKTTRNDWTIRGDVLE